MARRRPFRRAARQARRPRIRAAGFGAGHTGCPDRSGSSRQAPPGAVSAPRLASGRVLGDGPHPMKKKRRYLTATMPDGYVKTIGPTTDNFTHYWRIVAELENGKTEVFWGHSRSLAEARRKRAPAQDAARMRGWKSFAFEIVELVETPA